MTSANRIFGLATTYVGTVVGAGFASGQEIWSFFGRHGPWGFAGLLLSGFVFAWAGERAMDRGAAGGANDTYYQVLAAIAGKWAPWLDLILLCLLAVLTGVMLAGAGALCAFFAWPSWLGTLVTACLGLIVVGLDLPGLIMTNKVIVPCLFIAVIAVAARSIQPWRLPPATLNLAWLPAAILYASYNTILSLPVLAALGAIERNPRWRRAGSRWGAGILSLVGGLVLLALLCRTGLANGADIPMAALAARLGQAGAAIYAVVLWAEMFTTLVADVFGVAARLRQLLGGPRLVWAGATMLIGLAMSVLGFTRLIRYLYPAFGLICLFILFRLLRPVR